MKLYGFVPSDVAAREMLYCGAVLPTRIPRVRLVPLAEAAVNPDAMETVGHLWSKTASIHKGRMLQESLLSEQNAERD